MAKQHNIRAAHERLVHLMHASSRHCMVHVDVKTSWQVIATAKLQVPHGDGQTVNTTDRVECSKQNHEYGAIMLWLSAGACTEQHSVVDPSGLSEPMLQHQVGCEVAACTLATPRVTRT